MKKSQPLPRLVPSQGSDTVTGLDLVLHDLSVTKAFKKLAERHDALVDWVNDKVLNQQNDKAKN